jgi:uncharacterized membrane protein
VVAGAVGRQVAVDPADSAAEAAVLAEAGRAPAGSQMRTKEFLSRLEHDRIVQAIREAESKTSSQIRVYVQRGKLSADPLIAAQKRFHRLGMHKTRERNAVLIFVAPRAHKFAVVGDQAVHEKCGGEFWQRLIEAMRAHFQNEKFSRALVETIEETGKTLAAHFPKKLTGGNELPDDIIET